MSANQSSSSNDTWSCSGPIPDVEFYLPSLPVYVIVVFTLLGVCAAATVGVYIEIIVYFKRHLQDWPPRFRARFVLAVYPVLACTAFVAIMIPRSSGLNDLISAIYVSVCLYVFVAMLIGFFGGSKNMMKRLSGSHLRLSVPPLCCCCVCLPSTPLTSMKLLVLRVMVLQYAIVRPFFGYIIAIFWSEKRYGTTLVMKAPTNISTIIYSLSTLIATWSLSMVYRMSQEPFEALYIRPKFLCFQLVVVICGLQRTLLSILVLIPVCQYPLPAEAFADLWNHMLIIVEMLALLLVSRHYYRRDKLIDEPHQRILEHEVPPGTSDPPAQRRSSSAEPYDKTEQRRGGIVNVDPTDYGSIARPRPRPTIAAHQNWVTFDKDEEDGDALGVVDLMNESFGWDDTEELTRKNDSTAPAAAAAGVDGDGVVVVMGDGGQHGTSTETLSADRKQFVDDEQPLKAINVTSSTASEQTPTSSWNATAAAVGEDVEQVEEDVWTRLQRRIAIYRPMQQQQQQQQLCSDKTLREDNHVGSNELGLLEFSANNTIVSEDERRQIHSTVENEQMTVTGLENTKGSEA